MKQGRLKKIKGMKNQLNYWKKFTITKEQNIIETLTMEQIKIDLT